MNDTDDTINEITDVSLPRVDLVKGAANGTAFLIAKARMSAKAIDDLPDSDFAYIEPGGHKDEEGKTVPRSLRHFPVPDAAHVRNALARAADSPFGEKAMPKILEAAHRFGVHVSDDSGVRKAAEEEPPDADQVLADADRSPDGDAVLDGQAVDAPGDPDDPASPAWEAVDAARARGMVASVLALRAALTQAADREATEAVTGGEEEDAENAVDLSAAGDALDFLLDVLAPFAACEQAEADTRAADVMKAALVVKAGRVLSAANLAAVRSAITALQEVLTAAEPPVEPVAKAALEDVPEQELRRQVLTGSASERQAALVELGLRVMTGDEPVGAAEMGEASGDPEPAMPADDAGADDTDDTDTAADDTDDTPADDTDDASDMQTIPGTHTVVAPADDDDDDAQVAKAAEIEVLKAALAEQEAVYKTALASLEERLAKVEAQPAPGGPLLNGATGTPGLASRSPDQDSLTLLRKAADTETDPQRRAELREQLAVQEMVRKQSSRPAQPQPDLATNVAAVMSRFTTR